MLRRWVGRDDDSGHESLLVIERHLLRSHNVPNRPEAAVKKWCIDVRVLIFLPPEVIRPDRAMTWVA